MIKNLFLLPALIAGFGLIPAGRVTAQTFTTLHSFTALSNYTNSDGTFPRAGLILSGNTLYGTAQYGGSGGGSTSGNGTVFAVNTDGTGFTTLHTFTGGSDGGEPQAGLILSGNTLYGTASRGGSWDAGTVFKVNTNGTGFTNLYSFGDHPSDGVVPQAGLILSGNTLYGTANAGGSDQSDGTVFAVNTDGTGYMNVHTFTFGGLDNSYGYVIQTNSDGTYPRASLILSGNTLYGTASSGGTGWGTVFAVNINGTGFTTLHSFTAAPIPNTNSDGANPAAGLILSGNTLYGTAQLGGSSANGTVFKVNTDGTGFTNLHNFTGGGDGVEPYAGLVLSGNTLYGTASGGGSSGYGTVFAVNTDGTGFTNAYSFTALSDSATNRDGAIPYAGLILSGNTLYGTANAGGFFRYGTVFSLSLGSVSAPPLTIIPSGANVILTWPTNAAGFTLQSTTNLVLPAVWNTVSPGPVVVNGQNTVTNPISGAQQFYRLSQ